jgi:hypothetical protein
LAASSGSQLPPCGLAVLGDGQPSRQRTGRRDQGHRVGRLGDQRRRLDAARFGRSVAVERRERVAGRLPAQVQHDLTAPAEARPADHRIW